jgi:hypothetical protein
MSSDAAVRTPSQTSHACQGSGRCRHSMGDVGGVKGRRRSGILTGKLSNPCHSASSTIRFASASSVGAGGRAGRSGDRQPCAPTSRGRISVTCGRRASTNQTDQGDTCIAGQRCAERAGLGAVPRCVPRPHARAPAGSRAGGQVTHGGRCLRQEMRWRGGRTGSRRFRAVRPHPVRLLRLEWKRDHLRQRHIVHV